MTSPHAGVTMDLGTVSEGNGPSIPGAPSFPCVPGNQRCPKIQGHLILLCLRLGATRAHSHPELFHSALGVHSYSELIPTLSSFVPSS